MQFDKPGRHPMNQIPDDSVIAVVPMHPNRGEEVTTSEALQKSTSSPSKPNLVIDTDIPSPTNYNNTQAHTLQPPSYTPDDMSPDNPADEEP